MFLLRSAFWLVLAFMVMRPNVDLQSAVAELQTQAIAAGKDIIAEQILASDCDNLECAGRNALLTSALTATSLSVDPPMQDSSNSPVPFPRPRPDWMG